MDWIERLFHVAPDGGSGSVEVGIVAGVAIAAAMAVAGALKLGAKLRRRVAAQQLRPRSAQPSR
jgi:hypothetical protein